MRKVLICLLSILMMLPYAVAQIDVPSLSSEELLQLRADIDREIASRSVAGDSDLAVTVAGLEFTLLDTTIGKGNDGPAVGILLQCVNTGDQTRTVMYDTDIAIIQDGVQLGTTHISTDLPWPSVMDSTFGQIPPGAVRKLTFAGTLIAETGRIEIVFCEKVGNIPRGEDTYRGLFAFDLADVD